MRTKERELLEKAIVQLSIFDLEKGAALIREIKELLAQPEQDNIQYLLDQVARLTAENAMLKEKWSIPTREPLSDEEVRAKYRDIALDNPLYVPSYYAGFRDAEHQHCIGGGK